MPTLATTTLPGIYFLPAPRPTDLEIPPMDVAAFVGFTERGPLDTPTQIEEVSAYTETFGGNFTVAQTDDGQAIPAQIPDAVTAFFTNGGRRCYVVRVAGKNARKAQFTVPYLVRVAPDGTLQTVLLGAASEGDWANSVQLATRLQSKFLPSGAFGNLQKTATGFEMEWDTGGVAATIQAGEVLRVKGSFKNANTVLILPILRVESLLDDGANRVMIVTGKGWTEDINHQLNAADLSALFGVNVTTAELNSIERLRFEIVLREKGKRQQTVTDLAFCAPHSRFWGSVAAFESAGLLGELTDGTEFSIFLPQGMSPILTGSEWVTPTVSGEDDLVPFPTEAFFDPTLTALSDAPNALLQDAEHRVFIQGRKLTGMHSLLFQEDVALLAVPDANRADFLAPTTEIPGVEELQNSLLVRIQAEMQRFCEARRDVLGIFTLPEFFERRHCLNWLKALRLALGLSPDFEGNFASEGQADLSYVAAYHPWLRIADTEYAEQFRTVPSEGVVCGMIAKWERERGVWVAPANTRLSGVYGTAPKLSERDRGELFAAGINLLHAEPRDFRATSGHTLSRDKTLQQVSVRRLMMVLRKMVLISGQDYVFQNNSPQFRESVRVAIVNVLQRMFARGAFAGASPAQSYRVTTDSSVNPPASVDAGRFVVEIAVAPSQPAEFITILLIRSGDGSVSVS